MAYLSYPGVVLEAEIDVVPQIMTLLPLALSSAAFFLVQLSGSWVRKLDTSALEILACRDER